MKQAQVVTVGEGLLVLRAPDSGLLERTHQLEVIVGGAEINVAVGLARLGVPSAWMSRLPDNSLARNIAGQIQSVGVDIDSVTWQPEGKLGVMYSECGANPRPNRAIYDRSHSTACDLTVDDLDWDVIARAKILHTTGITAGISETARSTVLAMCKKAKSLGVKVCFDVNYRSQVWPEDEAAAFLPQIAEFVDIFFVGREEAERLLKIDAVEPSAVVREIAAKFELPLVVLTLGEEGSLAWDGHTEFYGPVYKVKRLNRFGAGDSFVAGFLYGMLQSDLSAAVEYGAAVAAYKMTLPNDNFPVIRLQDIERVIQYAGKVVEAHSEVADSHSEDDMSSYSVER